MADKKVEVIIHDDAYVEDKGKQLTGKQSFSEEEAKRLVEKLGVADYADIEMQNKFKNSLKQN